MTDKGRNTYLTTVALLTRDKFSTAELTDICFASVTQNYFQWKFLLYPTVVYFWKFYYLDHLFMSPFLPSTIIPIYLLDNLCFRKLSAKQRFCLWQDYAVTLDEESTNWSTVISPSKTSGLTFAFTWNCLPLRYPSKGLKWLCFCILRSHSKQAKPNYSHKSLRH